MTTKQIEQEHRPLSPLLDLLQAVRAETEAQDRKWGWPRPEGFLVDDDDDPSFKVTGFDTDPLLFWTEEEDRSAIALTPASLRHFCRPSAPSEDDDDPSATTLHDFAVAGEGRARLLLETGRPCWQAILAEEVGEVAREKNPEARVDELIQVAAVCLSWAQAIRARL